MLYRLRKFFPPRLITLLVGSLPFRIYHRNKLKEKSVVINAEITTKCNSECFMCTRGLLLQNKEISVKNMENSLIDMILKGIKEFDMNNYKITFLPMGLGEPLLYEDFFKLFKRIKKINPNIKIILTTNGILLNDSNIKKIIESRVDEIVISLNSLNNLDYLRKMGTGSYQKVRNNIKDLLTQRNNQNIESPRVFIQYLDYDNNKKKFHEEVKFWLRFMKGKDKCFIHSIVNQGGLYHSQPPKISLNKFPCTQLLKHIAIKVNGEIYPCCSCFYSGSNKIESLYLGNLKSTNLFTLFTEKNSRAKTVFNQMKKDDYTGLPLCKNCDVSILTTNCFFKLPKFLHSNNNVWL